MLRLSAPLKIDDWVGHTELHQNASLHSCQDGAPPIFGSLQSFEVLQATNLVQYKHLNQKRHPSSCRISILHSHS